MELESIRSKLRKQIEEQTSKYSLPDFKYYDVPDTHELSGYFSPKFKCPIRLPDKLRGADPREMIAEYRQEYIPDGESARRRSRRKAGNFGENELFAVANAYIPEKESKPRTRTKPNADGSTKSANIGPFPAQKALFSNNPDFELKSRRSRPIKRLDVIFLKKF